MAPDASGKASGWFVASCPATLQDRHGQVGAVSLACCTSGYRRRRPGDDVHAGCKVRHWISDPRVGLRRARLKRKAPQEATTANSMHASDRLIHSICGYLPWVPGNFRFVTGRCRWRPIAWQLPTATTRGIAHLGLATCSGCTPLHKAEARSGRPVSEREHRSHPAEAKPMQPAS